MLLIGLDAAAQYENFGFSVAHFDGVSLDLIDCETIRSEERLEGVISRHIDPSQPAILAIDAPLGWPLGFAKVLSSHSAGDSIEVSANSLFRRETDNFVHSTLGKRPLDVAADRIARASWRALHVLGCIRRHLGCDLPLAWSRRDIRAPSVIEVYPAGTLISRRLYRAGYSKPAAVNVRDEIASALVDEFSGIVKATASCHAFDAALCLLGAKDFLNGQAEPPRDHARAEIEGWIWVRLPECETVGRGGCGSMSAK